MNWLLVFDPVQCRYELSEFGHLLKSRRELSERDDILPFFRDRDHLLAFLGTCIPDIGPADRVAREFPLFGDFAIDAIVGKLEAAGLLRN